MVYIVGLANKTREIMSVQQGHAKKWPGNDNNKDEEEATTSPGYCCFTERNLSCNTMSR